jgi:hypothetical protein
MPTRGHRKKIEYEIVDGCFECTSHALNTDGYPHAHWDYKTVRLSRFIYEECFGEITEGMVVRHKCDNPKCINPEHLELGTQSDNVQDTIDRGRFKSNEGIDNPRALLTVEQVRAIKASDKTYVALASDYGVTKGCIANIKQGRTWKDVV